MKMKYISNRETKYCMPERDKEKHSIKLGWGLSVNLYVFKVTGCIYEDFLYVWNDIW